MKQRRILLVDDDPQIRSFVAAILRRQNYCVDQAADGIEALDILKAVGSTVDLLITDIKMPRMDGVALALSVAQIFPAMPVLFISGWADPLEDPGWRKPEYAFLRKPFLPSALIDKIEDLLNRHRPAAQNAATHD